MINEYKAGDRVRRKLTSPADPGITATVNKTNLNAIKVIRDDNSLLQWWALNHTERIEMKDIVIRLENDFVTPEMIARLLKDVNIKAQVSKRIEADRVPYEIIWQWKVDEPAFHPPLEIRRINE